MDAAVTDPKGKLIQSGDLSQGEYPLQAEAEMVMAMIRVAHDSVAGEGASKMADPIDMGWSVTFETPIPNGYSGVWSCWMNDKICFGWNKDYDIPSLPDKTVAEILGFEIMPKECGQLHGRFGSGVVPGRGGRVWVDDGRISSYTPVEFKTIDLNDLSQPKLAIQSYAGSTVDYGLSTIGFMPVEPENNDSPNCFPETISLLKGRFVALAIAQAALMGGATRFTIDHGIALSVTPDDLDSLGYQNPQTIKGTRAGHNLFGGDVIVAQKEHEGGTERAMLVSANSVFGWSLYRQFELGKNIINSSNLLTDLGLDAIPGISRP